MIQELKTRYLLYVGSVLCLVARSCLTFCDPMDYNPPGSSVSGGSPGNNTGVGCHALLQGVFPAQGSNPGLPHCRQILYQLSHQGIPSYLCYIGPAITHFLFPFFVASVSGKEPRHFLGILHAKVGT